MKEEGSPAGICLKDHDSPRSSSMAAKHKRTMIVAAVFPHSVWPPGVDPIWWTGLDCRLQFWVDESRWTSRLLHNLRIESPRRVCRSPWLAAPARTGDGMKSPGICYRVCLRQYGFILPGIKTSSPSIFSRDLQLRGDMSPRINRRRSKLARFRKVPQFAVDSSSTGSINRIRPSASIPVLYSVCASI